MQPNLLDNFPVVIEIPVAWGEMDAFQHVNNIVYFRYFESGRMAYFERIGFDKTMSQTGVGPILAHTQCRYRKALTYPDTTVVGTRVTAIKEDRFTMEICLVSRKLQKISAEGTAELVAFNYRENRKALLPEEIRKNIEVLEGRKF